MERGELARRNALGEQWAEKLLRIVDATIAVEEAASTGVEPARHESPLGFYWRTYSGRGFDRIAASGPPNELTAADLYACTLLSVPIHPTAGANLLDAGVQQKITDLLREVPTDVPIRDPGAVALLADDQPADQLYEYLRGPEFVRVGPVSASKLLAVKRPHLIPIRDSLVERALGAQNETVWWHPMVVAWQQPELGSAVDRLRRVVGSAVPDHVTDARLLDVTVWLHQKKREKSE